eukprot:scaffold33491_cov32-Prasinocladus_malaysianus.AAC.1
MHIYTCYGVHGVASWCSGSVSHPVPVSTPCRQLLHQRGRPQPAQEAVPRALRCADGRIDSPAGRRPHQAALHGRHREAGGGPADPTG